MDINIFALKEYAHNLKVLYVEDDESIKAQLTIFLQKFFPTIDTAKDGASGLELYKDGHYDIVITDIAMPHMDGITMSRKIKEINEEQIIIVTSAYNEVEKLMELIDIGVDKFVMKPITNKQFLILLYNVAKSIHLAAVNKELEKELVLKAKETEKILNFMNDQIAVIEGEKVVMMNKSFMALFGFNETEEIYTSNIAEKIDSGYGHNENIIDYLRQDTFDIHKVVIKDKVTGAPLIFLVKYVPLESNEKYLLSLTDITQLEQDIKTLSKQLHTNPFTGLPNKEALREVSSGLIKNGGEFGSIIFYIKNLEHIIAWHGKEKGLEVEKMASDNLMSSVTHGHFDKKPFIANFDKNFYVAICRKDDIKRLRDTIASLDVTSHMAQHNSTENETIHSSLETAVLEESLFSNVDEYFAKLKQKYEKIVF